jgi:hypothetical protein
VEDHEDEGGDDDDGGDEAEGLGDALVAGVDGGVIGDDAAEDEAGYEAAAVGPVVDAAHEKAEDEDGDDPGDEAGTELLHLNAGAAGGDGDHDADEAEDGGAGADRQAFAAEIGAGEKAGGSGDGVEEEEARRAVEFFDDGADVHEDHHVEADMDEAAVEVGGGDEAIPFVHFENGEVEAGAEAIGGHSTHAPENGEAAALAICGHGHEFDGEHDDVDDEEDGGDRSVAAEEFRDAFADLGHGEAEIGAAVVTAGGVDADERAACGADLRAGILISAAAEETARGVFPAVEAVLPLIGERQRVSLVAMCGGL